MEENITLKEKCYTQQHKYDYKLDTNKPIIVHIDGKNFSRMVKKRFKLPFDEVFVNAMDETAKYLCESVQGVKMAYVQSDEISLLIVKENLDSDIFYGGRLCKIQSILASFATAKFNQIMAIKNMAKIINGRESNNEPFKMNLYDEIPLYAFDCKVWNVENLNDAMAWFLFRNIDCVRNSKQQAAQTYLSHKELMKHSSDEQIEMLNLHYNIDWNNYRDGFKYGRIITRKLFTYKDLSYEARKAEEEAMKSYGYIVEEGGCVLIEHGEEDYVEVTRSRWVVDEGKDLTIVENRDWVKSLCPSLIEEVKEEN